MDAHRQAVRDAILEAAWALATEHGPSSTTMAAVAERAGIGRATLYKYYPDVDAILAAWHERRVAAHLEHLAMLRRKPADPARRLETVLAAYAEMVHHRGRHDAELMALMHRGEPVERAQRQLKSLVEGLLREAGEAGCVRTDVPPDELAGYCLHALTAAAGLPSANAVRRLVRVALAGLRPPS